MTGSSHATIISASVKEYNYAGVGVRGAIRHCIVENFENRNKVEAP